MIIEKPVVKSWFFFLGNYNVFENKRSLLWLTQMKHVKAICKSGLLTAFTAISNETCIWVLYKSFTAGSIPFRPRLPVSAKRSNFLFETTVIKLVNVTYQLNFGPLIC